MRSRSKRVLAGFVLLAFVAIVGSPVALADDPSPFDPPDARIKPPTGVTSSAEPTFFGLFLDWLILQARIHPAIG